MSAHPPNAVTGLPYTLVEIDEPQRALGERLRQADTLQWKLWITKYAWLLSLLTMAPGIALLAYILTGSIGFALAVAALATLTPAFVFWRRTRGLP
jgi:hypothetical protein